MYGRFPSISKSMPATWCALVCQRIDTLSIELTTTCERTLHWIDNEIVTPLTAKRTMLTFSHPYWPIKRQISKFLLFFFVVYLIACVLRLVHSNYSWILFIIILQKVHLFAAWFNCHDLHAAGNYFAVDIVDFTPCGNVWMKLRRKLIECLKTFRSYAKIRWFLSSLSWYLQICMDSSNFHPHISTRGGWHEIIWIF